LTGITKFQKKSCDPNHIPSMDSLVAFKWKIWTAELHQFPTYRTRT